MPDDCVTETVENEGVALVDVRKLTVLEPAPGVVVAKLSQLIRSDMPIHAGVCGVPRVELTRFLQVARTYSLAVRVQFPTRVRIEAMLRSVVIIDDASRLRIELTANALFRE
jgi:predicted TIM-barrel enzyme